MWGRFCLNASKGRANIPFIQSLRLLVPAYLVGGVHSDLPPLTEEKNVNIFFILL